MGSRFVPLDDLADERGTRRLDDGHARAPQGGTGSREDSLLALQQTAGNQAVARMVASRTSAGPAMLAREPAHKEIPIAGVGSPGSTLFDWEGDKDDTSVWFGWNAQWIDDDRTGSVEINGVTTPSVNDRGAWTEQGVGRMSLPVRAGRSGTLKITVDAHFFVDMPGEDNQKYVQTCGSSWHVAIGDDGTLKSVGTPNGWLDDVTEADARLRLLVPAATQEKEAREFTVAASYQGAQRSEGSSTSSSWGIGVDFDPKKIPGIDKLPIPGISPSYSRESSTEKSRALPAAAGMPDLHRHDHAHRHQAAAGPEGHGRDRSGARLREPHLRR